MSSKANTDKALRRYMGSVKTVAITATAAEVSTVGHAVNEDGVTVVDSTRWPAVLAALNSLKANNPNA